MKLKNLKKKIRRLEKRLQEGPNKLAKLKQKLQAAEAAKAMKAATRSAARATGSRPGAKSSPTEKKAPARKPEAKKPASVTKPKKKMSLSPERRAHLSAVMKAKWAAKRAAEANAQTASTGQGSAAEPPPQTPENRPDGA
jgi:hypothetical protein